MKSCFYNGITPIDYQEESKNIFQYFLTVCFNTRLLFFLITHFFPKENTRFILKAKAKFVQDKYSVFSLQVCSLA